MFKRLHNNLNVDIYGTKVKLEKKKKHNYYCKVDVRL